MNTVSKALLSLPALLLSVQLVMAQPTKKEWTLRDCIDYALQNNIQIRKMQVEVKVNQEGYEEAKASRNPSLGAGVSESYTHQKALSGNLDNDKSSFTGNYSLHSDVTLYNGNKITNNILQKEVNVKSAGLGVQESENTIELAVTSAYLQVLYAREALQNAGNTLDASLKQRDRAKTLYEAGYIAESNYAQVEAQYSNDSYTLVTDQNEFNRQMLNLKQLLELDIDWDLNLVFPELKDEDVLQIVPDKQVVYKHALGFMPEIANSQLAIQSADLDIQMAKAGKLPTLALSASTSTGQSSSVSTGFATQLGNNFYQNAGLSLSIPIYSNRQVKTAISRAELGLQTARLSSSQIQKDLLSKVESSYLDAISAQSRFLAAKEQLNSTLKSYSLTEDQFNLGMKNTVDLLTEKNKYLAAQEEYLQAKYTAILNYKVLDFYQQKRIEL
jgi:outer membrane protein